MLWRGWLWMGGLGATKQHLLLKDRFLFFIRFWFSNLQTANLAPVTDACILLFPVKNAPLIICSWPAHDALICPFQPAPELKSNGLKSALFRSPHLRVLEFRNDFLLVPSCPGFKLLVERKLLGWLASQSLSATLLHLISNSEAEVVHLKAAQGNLDN